MKIDVDIINYHAVQLIEDTIGNVYSYLYDDSDKARIATLAEISGILRMADAMKEATMEEAVKE